MEVSKKCGRCGCEIRGTQAGDIKVKKMSTQWERVNVSSCDRERSPNTCTVKKANGYRCPKNCREALVKDAHYIVCPICSAEIHLYWSDQ